MDLKKTWFCHDSVDNTEIIDYRDIFMISYVFPIFTFDWFEFPSNSLPSPSYVTNAPPSTTGKNHRNSPSGSGLQLAAVKNQHLPIFENRALVVVKSFSSKHLQFLHTL